MLPNYAHVSALECIAEGQPRLKYSSKQTDVWSMGVILVNMISGRNPWRYATVDDSCFQAYLQDNNFLFKVLPISTEANAIIKRIFSIDPLCRITLSQLKEEIAQVDTFFRAHQTPPAQIAQQHNSIECVESGWQTESDPLPAHRQPPVSSSGALFTSPIIMPPDTSSLNQVIVSGSRLGVPETLRSGQSHKSSNDSSSATDSSKSSLAVKTPSVHAVAPVAVAQPGKVDDDIEESLVLPGTLLDKNLRSPGGKVKSISIKNGRNIIRAAVQRIKDFSTPAGNVAN
jgi:serine/threonine protein kinase